jgi:glycosyltransferase involved in cell wall biosynthesis
MRILHIANHIERIGNGIVNVAIDLACMQAKYGHEIAIASAGGEYEELLEEYNVKHFYLNQGRQPINLIQAISEYRKIIYDFQPDIVHAHMMTGVVLAATLRFGCNYSLVSTVHNEFQRSAILMGLADRVIAVSNAVSKAMSSRGIPQQKIRVVANGTLGSPRLPRVEEYQPVTLQRPAITTVAGMYRRKGIGELIDAFIKIAPSFPAAHLYLVGDGPDRGIFEQKVKNINLTDTKQTCREESPKAYANRIHFTGFQANPQSYMLSSDIFVLASWKESFGLVLTEAREAGCAIVASDVDGIPETLDNRQAGILFPIKDSDALADVLFKLLKDDQELQNWKEKA